MMWKLITPLFVVCCLPAIVKVQLLKECAPDHNCLTCYTYPFNCNNCTTGFYLTRGGAYYTCRKCPSGCLECSNRFSCNKCEYGHWGATCQNRCSRGCLLGACLHDSGYCKPEYCKPNFVGKKCDRCIAGKYGMDCNSSSGWFDLIFKNNAKSEQLPTIV